MKKPTNKYICLHVFYHHIKFNYLFTGKTTQVPQFILEQCIGDGIGASTNILVTQPRRLSTMSVANRVANERGERIGEKSRQVCFLYYQFSYT